MKEQTSNHFEHMKDPRNIILGIQHLLAMYAGAVIVPLIVASALKMTIAQTTYLVAADIMMSGLATFLQVYRGRYIGIGLPVVLACTFTAVSPMIHIGQTKGIGVMYGAVFVSGLVVMLLAPIFAKLNRFFPPVVMGSVVTLIGVTLMPVAMNHIAGGQGVKDFGSLKNLAVAFLTFLVILCLYRFSKGFLQSIAILIGLLLGTLASAALGMVDLSPIAEAHWVQLPSPFHLSTFKFDFPSIVTMSIVAIVSIIESTGVYYVLGDITKQAIKEEDLRRGYLSEGLAVMLGALVNTFPYTTYSQNVGLIQMSGVKKRAVMFNMVILMLLAGSIPKIGALATIIPQPVLGGAMLCMFGSVLAYGIKMLGQVNQDDSSNMMIIACSVGIGLGVTAVPGVFAQLPDSLSWITGSGIVLGTITAVVLNLFFHGCRSEK
ncbi:nucleobase:cation symporter-2 family protein [Atopobacter sp. AH10]|uniref:nucleobase:cation symporter-2 family protein n=1 Tax=Atopobacter sp. AH10 TaxID=2315861 RepID=UPI002693D252|nr:nucleobase:cation symporter-2 family protein [Atopobacter sp. AH10]